MKTSIRKRIAKYLALKYLRKRSRSRRYWVHPMITKRKIDGEHIKIDEMYHKFPDKFFQYTRLMPTLFDKLLGLVEERISRRNTKFRESISARIRLYVILRYLTTGDHIRTIATSFSLGRSTVWNIIRFDMPAIWETLQDQYVMFPDKLGLSKIADGFLERWNYPNCLGAVDGKHVVIEAPANSGSLYLNYKGSFSIVLLASCDADYRFTYVDVGGFGKQSDGGVFSNSTLGTGLREGNVPLPDASLLPNAEDIVPFHFVGDEAFPLSIYLMRPFPGKTLTHDQRIFNYRLSRARRCIENTFGIMASRFRVFRRPIAAEPTYVEQIVLAAVALHNFIMTEEKAFEPAKRKYSPPGYSDTDDKDNGAWRKQGSRLLDCSKSIAAQERQSREMRENLVKYFNATGKVEWQESSILQQQTIYDGTIIKCTNKIKST